jgi:hypothetical protein
VNFLDLVTASLQHHEPMDKEAPVVFLLTALTIYASGLTRIFSGLLHPETSQRVKGRYGVTNVITAGCEQPEAKHEHAPTLPVLVNQRNGSARFIVGGR